MRSVELFAGCGGLALGMELAGFEPELVVEWDEKACETLRLNRPSWNVLQCDVRKIPWKWESPGIDLVAGGPPCQPFSMGGRAQGEMDPRDMFPEFVRAVRHLKPKAFIVENVRGLFRPRFREYYSAVLSSLALPGDGLGYNVSHSLVDAANYGVPQHRHRVFIVGIRQDLKHIWKMPEPTHGEVDGLLRRRTVRDAISSLPSPLAGWDQGYNGHTLRQGAKLYQGHTGSPWDEPAKALKAGVHGVPGGENMLRFDDGSVRYFTVREAARLQTFPDGWHFPHSWSRSMRQLGNAVPVRLARIVGESVHSLIRG